MSKIDELIDWYIPKTCQVGFEREMMIKYAEYYAQKCINAIASNYVTVNCPTWEIVDRKTILEFELPDHE